MDYQERIAGGRVILHRNKENSIEKALEKFCHKGQQGVGCFCSFVCFGLPWPNYEKLCHSAGLI